MATTTEELGPRSEHVLQPVRYIRALVRADADAAAVAARMPPDTMPYEPLPPNQPPKTNPQNKQRTELRIEVARNREAHVTVTAGSAEIFGAELPVGQRVRLQGACAVAVFTWDGATVAVEEGLSGPPEAVYVAEDTPMAAYLNAHQVIANMRADAARRAEAAAAGAAGGAAAGPGPVEGPRVAIVGPVDTGKSTLCRTLLNWAVRTAPQGAGCGGTGVAAGTAAAAPAAAPAGPPSPPPPVVLVDLDVGQGAITAPGTLAAAPVEAPYDAEEACFPSSVPLVYFYGHASPSDNPELYRALVARLAAVLDQRAERDPRAAAGGLIINTAGFVDQATGGYDLLVDALRALRVDVVLVMEADRLHAQLSAHLLQPQQQQAGAAVDGGSAGGGGGGGGPATVVLGAMGRPPAVVKLPRSGGVVPRPASQRKEARAARVREYFYGARGNLLPASITVPAESLLVFRIGGGFRAPSSALPLGAQPKADPLRLAPTAVSPELVNSLLAVSLAPTPQQILAGNVAGFVLVTAVDTARSTVTLLCPCGGGGGGGTGPLPGRYLIAGSLKAYLD
jgi:polyribonucleotide 5'-hydroxyl-kinase